MKFTFADYTKSLKIALTQFDRLTSAAQLLDQPSATRNEGSLLFMRHDCERDLNKALKMAQIERQLGISSSYYVRVHSEYYNLLLPHDRNIVRSIAELGHEIGLHYEPKFYADDGLTFMEGIQQDLTILRYILGPDIPLRTMSPHQPTLSPPDFVQLEQQGLVDVYAHPDFKPLKYYSDSGMCWREKSLRQAVESEFRCQFLIHPDFWNEEELTWNENIDRRCESCSAQLTEVAEQEKEILRQYLANRAEHDAKFRAILEAKP